MEYSDLLFVLRYQRHWQITKGTGYEIKLDRRFPSLLSVLHVRNRGLHPYNSLNTGYPALKKIKY